MEDNEGHIKDEDFDGPADEYDDDNDENHLVDTGKFAVRPYIRTVRDFSNELSPVSRPPGTWDGADRSPRGVDENEGGQLGVDDSTSSRQAVTEMPVTRVYVTGSPARQKEKPVPGCYYLRRPSLVCIMILPLGE